MPKSPALEQISLRLPPAELALIDRAAKQQGIPRAEWVRRAAMAEYERQQRVDRKQRFLLDIAAINAVICRMLLEHLMSDQTRGAILTQVEHEVNAYLKQKHFSPVRIVSLVNFVADQAADAAEPMPGDIW